MMAGRVLAKTFLAYTLRTKTTVAAFTTALPFYATPAFASSSSRSMTSTSTSTLTKQRGGGDGSGSGDSATTCLSSTAVDTNEAALTDTKNPLLADWSSQPYHLPPFGSIEPSHFPEALKEGMKAHLDDLNAIVAVEIEDADFENTIAAYDRAGILLDRVSSVFSNLCSSKNTDDLQAVQTEMTPLLSRHRSACFQLPGLFERIQHVYDNRNDDQDLNSEQVRLVERIHLDFTRAGASLTEEQQSELADLNSELASLSTSFQQNVMKDEETYELILHLEDLAGCPDFLIEAARTVAEERNKESDEYVVTLSRSLVEPFLTFADRRDLRKKAWEAWISRGEMHPDRDNLSIATKMLKLRQRIAEIHGYPSFAAYQCVDRMAKTPERVMELLENVWDRAKESANLELEAMEEFVKESGIELEGGIEPYDWRYIAEKVRKAKYDYDGALLKPYLPLKSVVGALFDVSSNLFGLRYQKVDDIETYHPDVETYLVLETLPDGSERLVSLFLHDNFARPFKSSGAWMSEYRSQTRNLAPSSDPIEGVPVVSNNNNFAKGSQETLLSYDDAITLFHEFGHAHHGMLSNAGYGRLASTNVLTDFVELPSTLMENWFEQRSVIKKCARHYQTGEPVPDDLLDKLEASRSFQQGFYTIEYTISALMDMALHQVQDLEDFDMAAFEKSELERLGMPRGIVMRHRPAHFQHLFSTDMYAAGYYVYLWADVLAADAFAAFEEAGDIFDKTTADKARRYIYGAGNTQAPDELFRKFRGRDPEIDFMLNKKGLLGAKSKEQLD